jgi:hypothetical protein
MESLINNDLERMWKKATVAYLRYYLGLYLKKMRKTTEKLRISGLGAEI